MRGLRGDRFLLAVPQLRLFLNRDHPLIQDERERANLVPPLRSKDERRFRPRRRKWPVPQSPKPPSQGVRALLLVAQFGRRPVQNPLAMNRTGGLASLGKPVVRLAHLIKE